MSALWLSFRDFLKAGARPRTPLARAIVVALAIKFCVVMAMRIFLFGADHRVTVTDASMMDALGPSRAAPLSTQRDETRPQTR